MQLFETNKLYVIGNGFDKHHGIKCGYLNFKEWLHDNCEDVYENLKRIYGDLNDDWWSKFEENLTKFDPDYFPNMLAEATYFEQLRMLENRYGEEGRAFIDRYELEKGTINNKYDRCGAIARFEMKHLKEDLCEAFGEWVKDIELPDKSKKDCDLDENAIFFTFNYTRTLEDLYEIEDDQVIHLHGSVDNNQFIIGHNMTAMEMQTRDLEQHMYERDPNDDEGEDEARAAMFDVVEELKKPVEDILLKYGPEFYSLNSIEELEVLGFSYSPIDLPYLEKIIEETGPDVKAKFGWHSEEDRLNAEKFKQKMNLSDCTLFKF